MKRIISLCFGLIFIASFLFGQNQIDALRYMQTIYGGTARSVSMGGAFGALGGDISSLSYNPGGIAVFRTNELTMTPTLLFDESTSKFLEGGKSSMDNAYNFNLNNFGIVGSYKSDNDAEWANVNFAVGYNKTNTFNQNITISGINTNSSMVDSWQNDATGISPNKLDAFGSGLAFDTWLIDTIRGTNYEYGNALPTLGQEQRKNIAAEGSMGEFLFACGANYAHKLYIGFAFGLGHLRYEHNITYSETDINNTIHDFKGFTYREHLTANGTGFNIKLGAIYRPIEWLRIGAAVHTPTFWSIDENFNTTLDASFDTPDNEGNSSYAADSPKNEFTYELTTPFKAIGSIAVMLKDKGLISLDYEYFNYSKGRMRSDSYDFNSENDVIQNLYNSSSNIRLGGEYRLGVFSLRAGYGFYGSPYKSSSELKDAVRQALSAGVGMNAGSFYIDFAFVRSNSTRTELFYDAIGEGTPLTGGDVTSKTNRMLMTFGLRF
jgi:hypothetical protein